MGLTKVDQNHSGSIPVSKLFLEATLCVNLDTSFNSEWNSPQISWVSESVLVFGHCSFQLS